MSRFTRNAPIQCFQIYYYHLYVARFVKYKRILIKS